MPAMNVVVTGASQGIGAAIAEAFAGEPGARVALVARNRENLDRVAERCRQRGAEARAFVCDVTRDDSVSAAATEILESWGTPRILVNNAGRFRPGTLEDTDGATLRELLEINLTSALLVTRAFLPSMREAGAGHLFFLASVASLKAYPGALGYCAAKHGLLGLARSVREELKDGPLRVTTLLPGATWTPSWEGSGVPEERMMPATDIARAIVEIQRLSPQTVVEEILLRPQQGDV